MKNVTDGHIYSQSWVLKVGKGGVPSFAAQY